MFQVPPPTRLPGSTAGVSLFGEGRTSHRLSQGLYVVNQSLLFSRLPNLVTITISLQKPSRSHRVKMEMTEEELDPSCGPVTSVSSDLTQSGRIPEQLVLYSPRCDVTYKQPHAPGS